MATKYFCYCIGGTGARVAEVAAHLCAMKMIKKVDDLEPIEFIIVDKDDSCGGTTQAKETIRNISTLSGLTKTKKLDDAETIGFCNHELNIASWNFSNALSAICNNTANPKLDQVLGSDADDKLVMRAFYNKEARETDTEKGFYGKPSLGTSIFEYMLSEADQNNQDNQDDQDNQDNQDNILKPVEEFLGRSTNNRAKVFIIGSIFGGTGAAVFSNLAAYMRKHFEKRNKDLLVSGVLLLPYFSFGTRDGDGDGTPLINSGDFGTKSYLALSQYAQNEHLMRKELKDNESFDSLYICGQDPLHVVGEYANGGQGQKNHFDLVDLIAADAMVDFFNKDFYNNGAATGLGKIYEYRFSATAENGKIPKVRKTEIEELAVNLNKMFRFVVFLVARFATQFALNYSAPGKKQKKIFGKSENKCDKMWESVLTFQALFDKTEFEANFNNIVNDMNNFIGGVLRYCTDYIRLMDDISKTGYNWANDTKGTSENYNNLFGFAVEKDYISHVSHICSCLTKGNIAGLEDMVTELLADEKKNSSGNKSIDDVTEELKRAFSDITYAGTDSYDKRFGDYIYKALEIYFS